MELLYLVTIISIKKSNYLSMSDNTWGQVKLYKAKIDCNTSLGSIIESLEIKSLKPNVFAHTQLMILPTKKPSVPPWSFLSL